MGSDPLRYRLKFFLLTLLAIKPSHGYELSRRIEEITEGIIKASPGSIYPMLRDLRDEGLIVEEVIVESGRARKMYRLTRRGMEEVLRSLDIAQNIVGNMLELITEARRGLEKALTKGGPIECPPTQLINRLEGIRRIITGYLNALREKERLCR